MNLLRSFRKSARKIELRDVILGGQDGLVNVLGLSLGLFAAHADSRIIVIAGLAAGFSEAASMGAVAYTSALADRVRMSTTSRIQLVYSSIIVGSSALIGAVIPLIPFEFFDIKISIYLAIFLSGFILFVFGILKAVFVSGKWWKSGLEMLVIGLLSAFVGFVIGYLLKAY